MPRKRSQTKKLNQRLALGLVGLALLTPKPARAAPFEVILQDGSLLDSWSKPLMAMGRVSFTDAEGRRYTLNASLVDLNATRQALGGPTPLPSNLKELREGSGQIQLAGVATLSEAERAALREKERLSQQREEDLSLARQERALTARLRDVRRILHRLGDSPAAEAPWAHHEKLMVQLREVIGQQRANRADSRNREQS